MKPSALHLMFILATRTNGQLSTSTAPQRLRHASTGGLASGPESGSGSEAPVALSSSTVASKIRGSTPPRSLEARLARAEEFQSLEQFQMSESPSMDAIETVDGPAEIAGGQPLNRGDNPYLVSLFRFDSFFCTASLIAPDIVLSAAHCFEADYMSFMRVDVNRYSLTDDTNVTSFEMCPTEKGIGCDIDTQAFVVRHEGVNLNAPEVYLDNDYALVFLPKAIDGIVPIKLNTDPNIPAVGDTLEASGWGPTGGPDMPHAVDMMAITSSECADILGGPITSQMLCVNDAGRSACDGDSGGPIILKTPDGPVQVGLTSFGCLPGARGRLPMVFARISSGMDWIKDAACEYSGQWCDECVDVEDGDVDDNDLDTGVDRLPGFIEDMIESGALSIKEDASTDLERPKKENRELPEESEMMMMEGKLPEFITGSKSEVQIKRHPYLVSFGLKQLAGFNSPTGHVCAGTLIAPNAVLSAASCFTDSFGYKVKLDFVEINRYDQFSDPGVARIYLKKSDIFIHPDYNFKTKDNDMALVILSDYTAILEDIEPVKLNRNPATPVVSEEMLEVFGWGNVPQGEDNDYVQYDDGFNTNLPRTLSVGYVPNENDECFDPEFEIKSSMMCAGSTEPGADGPCTLDEGDPLIQETPKGPVQVGVFSFGKCNPLSAPEPQSPPCENGEKLLIVEVTTDSYPYETSWELKNLCLDNIQLSINRDTEYTLDNKAYSHEYCVPDNEYKFTIYDSAGDGICCDCGDGSYTVTYDGKEVAKGGEFEPSDTSKFGNPDAICGARTASVYSRVSSAIDWIEHTVECKSKSSKKSTKSRKKRP